MMVIVAPDAAIVGVKLVMVGVPAKINPAEFAMPPGVVTCTIPLVPTPTVAII